MKTWSAPGLLDHLPLTILPLTASFMEKWDEKLPPQVPSLGVPGLEPVNNLLKICEYSEITLPNSRFIAASVFS